MIGVTSLLDGIRPSSKELHLPYSDIHSVLVRSEKGTSIDIELNDGRIVRFFLEDKKVAHKLISMFYVYGINVIN